MITLTVEQLKFLAKSNPKFVAKNYPEFMLQVRPTWMLRNASYILRVSHSEL